VVTHETQDPPRRSSLSFFLTQTHSYVLSTYNDTPFPYSKILLWSWRLTDCQTCFVFQRKHSLPGEKVPKCGRAVAFDEKWANPPPVYRMIMLGGTFVLKLDASPQVPHVLTSLPYADAGAGKTALFHQILV
jgi:hypothetical protein